MGRPRYLTVKLPFSHAIHRVPQVMSYLDFCTLSFHQLTAGISAPLLTSPSTPIPYLEKGWITSLRSFLAFIDGGTIEIGDQFCIHPVRYNDTILMDKLNDPDLPATTVERINHCQLYLQVTSLADICDGNGTAILPAAYHGHTLPHSHSTLWWPRQPCPPARSWQAWQHALRKWFLTDEAHSLCLRPSAVLGEWLPSLHTHHRRWHYHVDISLGNATRHCPPTKDSTATLHPALSIPNPEGKFRVSGKGVKPRPAPATNMLPPSPGSRPPYYYRHPQPSSCLDTRHTSQASPPLSPSTPMSAHPHLQHTLSLCLPGNAAFFSPLTSTRRT